MVSLRSGRGSDPFTVAPNEARDSPPRTPNGKPKKLSQELARLTQWGDWIAKQAELKAKQSHASDPKRRMEEQLARDGEEKEAKRVLREEQKREAARLARIAAEEEKRKREEARLEKKLERDKRREAAEDANTEMKMEDTADILETRSTQSHTFVLVDGYRPFMAHWRDDVEIPIRKSFFVSDIHESKTEERTQLPFKSAMQVLNEKVKKYKDYKGLEPRLIQICTPTYQHIKEDYFLRESQDFYLDPLEEIGRVMETLALSYIPDDVKLQLYNPLAPYDSLAGRYSTAFYSRDYDTMFTLLDEFNEFVQNLQKEGRIEEHLKRKTTFSRMVMHELLNQVYSRSVSPQVFTLRVYRAFSNNVYGELLPKFCSMVFDQCGLNEKSCFIDLGSGVGNVTIQAALEYGCESYGCEIMENCSKLAEFQEVAFKERCALYGIQPGPVGFFHRQSFVGNPEVKNVIDRCDVILVNNFLFEPELNKETLLLFLDVKVGTKIISLKKVIPEAVYHDLDDEFLSMFLVEKFQFGSGCVSWTDAPGYYYITTFTGEVSLERKQQLNKSHNTRRRERAFLDISSRLSSNTPEDEKENVQLVTEPKTEPSA